MSFLVSILIFGLVVVIHEGGHFIVAKLSGIKVLEFSVGMGPQLFGKQIGETLYSIRLIPFGGYCAMEGEDEESTSAGSFSSAPVQSRISVVVAGAIMNLILGFIVLLFLVNGDRYITSKKIYGFHEGARTQLTGLMADDEILAINGRKCYIADDLFYEFARTENATVDFVVLRDGKRVELNNVEFDTYTDEDGIKNLVIDFTVYPVQKSFTTVTKEAFNWTVSIARLVFLSFVDLVTGHVAVNKISGPVGIVTTISEAVSYGYRPVLMILAMITINLGVFNLFPIPALDGGRLVFLLIEYVTGRPVNPKYEIAINARGMIVLLGFMSFVTFSDITKLLF